MAVELFSILPTAHQNKRLPPIKRSWWKKNATPMICRAVFEEISIHANGDIVCSCADPTGVRVYGNVYKDRISDIFNGPLYREIREWHLGSQPGSWCPVIEAECAGRVGRASAVDVPENRHVKFLQLEPVSFCNLRCPSCPVTTHFPDPDMESRRNQLLPLEVMLDIIDQLPDLETMLFYNFGEPFLHRDAVPFLRELKRRRPDVFVATSTNALAFTAETLAAVVNESLVNRLVFAIDGAFPESYAKYRINGNHAKAMRNLETAAGRASNMEVIWQYILFEWNDSDEELAAAKEISARLGVPINWILTHTPGASKRYTAGTPAMANLTGNSVSPTCEVQLQDFLSNKGIAKGKYLASISADHISGSCGSAATVKVTLENRSQQTWESGNGYAYHLGLMLRTQKGKKLLELPGVPLPSLKPGDKHTAEIEIQLPREAGEYQMLIDVVEQNVCWFFERGSPPMVQRLEVI